MCDDSDESDDDEDDDDNEGECHDFCDRSLWERLASLFGPSEYATTTKATTTTKPMTMTTTGVTVKTFAIVRSGNVL